MGRKRREPRGKKVKPTFWVFCEGETEEAYISLLRSKYRLPIIINSKKAGNRITENYIENYKQGETTHEKDKDFLIYDADVKAVLGKLKKIKSATLIASNPSIELWFLLHYKNQTAVLNESDCIRELCNRNRNRYKKGVIDNKLSERLNEKYQTACKRASKLKVYKNPSTNMNKFIEILEKAAKGEY